MFEPDPFRPVTPRQRWGIALLAVAAAVAVTWSLTRRAGVLHQAQQHPADRARCAPGQTTDCVGGMAGLIVLPTAAPASR